MPKEGEFQYDTEKIKIEYKRQKESIGEPKAWGKSFWTKQWLGIKGKLRPKLALVPYTQPWFLDAE